MSISQIDGTVNGTVSVTGTIPAPANVTSLEFTGALSATKTIDCSAMIDAQVMVVYSSAGITSVTLAGAIGDTIVGDLTTLAAGQAAMIVRNGTTIIGTVIGGGTGGLVPITASVTKNVPADFATLPLAIAFAQNNLFLNGATCHITVDDTETISAQIALGSVSTNGELAHMSITGLGMGPTVDYTTFSVDALGLKAFITVTGGSVGNINGTWRQTSGGTSGCCFLANYYSKTSLGELGVAPITVNGVSQLSSVVSGDHIEESVTANCVGVAVSAALGANVRLMFGMYTGAIVAGGGSQISVEASGITYAVGDPQMNALNAFDGSAIFISSAFGANSVTGSVQALIGGKVQGFISNLIEPATPLPTAMLYVATGSIDVQCGVTLQLGSSVVFTDAASTGSVNAVVSNNAIATSTGMYAKVINASSVRVYSGAGVGTIFTGGASQALYTATANGQIIA
jgi:hypothetical protein